MTRTTGTAIVWLTVIGITMTGSICADDAGEVSAPRHSDHAGLIPADYPPPPGLTEGWFEPWRHIHFSRRGTPFAHPFNLEPAFLDRDLRIMYSRTREHDEVERELEIELEWGFTRRIGMMVEAPFVEIDPDNGPAERGLGDIAIAPRFLLIDKPRFLLSANLEVTLPTGSRRKELGSGDVSVAPFVTTWLDLGHWFSLQTEWGVEWSGWSCHDVEAFYGAALTYSLIGPAFFRESPRHVQRGHFHYPPGLINLVVEAVGRTEWRTEDDGPNHQHGDGRGRTVVEVLFGMGYSLTDSIELRGGYQIPVGGRREIDNRAVFGASYHF